MTRMIDVGIDLGTTNSTIAVMDGVDARVIPNKVGSTVTPSAVWVDGRGRVRVGKEAREHALIDENGSARAEFKELMGGGDEARHTFPDGTSMLPEELSAEVLKSLKLDYQTNTGQDLTAAVITVPAAFSNPSTTATRRAAELAGFVKSPLLLEPAAASLAYGFQSEADNVYWFVYDFGGGTFDAAVMRLRDGQIQVAGHNGNNHLGGKLIDWDIVERKVVPVLTAQYDLPDFTRANKQWEYVLSKLKLRAEEAKIEVCRTREPSEIFMEFLCKDASGRPVEVEVELTPEDVMEVSQRHIDASLDLCRKTLADVNLSGGDMARVLMVGGSTLNPWVRDAVASEISDSVEFGIDPVTVVARGAAIFASMQEHPGRGSEPVEAGTWTIDVIHEPVGNVTDPDIGGRVSGPDGASPEGFTIELIDGRTRWSTGRVALGADGTFMTQLHAERKRKHEFLIELCDSTGTRVPVSPASITYIMGILPPSHPPVARTIGVGLHDKTVHKYFPKGTPLPAIHTYVHHAAVALRAGEAEDELRIPLVEGDRPRVERNQTIGWMTIRGSDVRADVFVGDQIEITVRMDESQLLTMDAEVTKLEQSFHVEFRSLLADTSTESVLKEIEREQRRLIEILAKAKETGAVRAEDLVSSIVAENALETIAREAREVGNDPAALRALQDRLGALGTRVDEAEDLVALPELLNRASEALSGTRDMVEAYGSLNERHQLEQLEELLERATRTNDPDLLRLRTTQLESLKYQILEKQPVFHLGRFEWLSEQMDEMRDPDQARRLVNQGRRQREADDLEGLKATNRQLISLLKIPEVPGERIIGII